MGNWKFWWSQGDHNFFIKQSTTGKITTLIVYVDNSIIIKDIEKIEKLKKQLAKEFEIKNSSEFKYFLGVELAHSRNGIFISQ